MDTAAEIATPAGELIVRGQRISTRQGPRPAALWIEDGVVRSLEPPTFSKPGVRVLEAGDAWVSPGVIDTHVHVNEPGRSEWEGFATATRAAAAGGVTTLVDMPLNSTPATTSAAALRAKAAAAAGQSTVDYGFWGGVIPGNADDLEPLADGGVLGFKCFLAPSGVDDFPAIDRPSLLPAMHQLAELGAPLLVHAELPEHLDPTSPRPGSAERRRYARYLASRPPVAEVAAIEQIVELVRQTGCAAHIVHVACAEALPVLAAARAEGLPITAESCPHYLTFSAEEVSDGATAFKCAPPIRTSEHREALWRGLENGVLDLVASDHSPCPPALKSPEAGDFFAAWGGIASLQLTLPALWTAAAARGHDPTTLSRWLSAAPARLAGLDQRKGKLEPGFDADLVIWEPDQSFAVEPTKLEHRHPFTPWAGRQLRGRILHTLVRGVAVFENGRLTGRRPGQWQRSEPRNRP